jgi:hypothetical protein
MSWDDLAAKMDADVDTVLGDTILFSADAGSSWSSENGFVLSASMTNGIIGMDEPLGARMRVKMARDLFGASGLPGRSVRLQHARLGQGTYRPAGGEPEEQGRYILFDVQRV